ncbi:MAG TPA: hypothetical protein VIM61_00680 [Chthoniobacterales bacterium]
MNAPLINLREYAKEPFWKDDLGIMFWIWRRQAGKSFTAAAKALRRMMEIRGLLSVFCSASVNLGVEFVRKEAQIWALMLDTYRKAVAAQGLMLTSSADNDRGELLDIDAIADLFEHQKLETKIWHDRTTYSRSIVVAPNPDTAVGWTGDIWFDEVGRMPEFKDVLEACLPFMSSNPQFRLLGITTPPPDDQHYSWEITMPGEQEFKTNPRGNWYRSQAGYLCHRVDAWDAHAAGVPMYDDQTREPITPEEHRQRAFDKTAWDRNFGLKFITGGQAAVSLGALQLAMAGGRGQCLGIDVTEEINIAA